MQRKNYVLSFSIDTRNYLHIKKLFKIILKEWGRVDFIFHFDTYTYNKPIEDFPIHNLKLIYQWNVLTLFNLIKAEKKFINQHPKYITTQVLNSKNIAYYFKNDFLRFLKDSIDIRTIYLPEEYFYVKANQREIEKKIFLEKQIERIAVKIKKKRKIFLNLFDQIKFKLNLY